MFSSFFLGANSGRGFHSFYDELIDLREAKTVYILKGGPGSGKSSVMRSVVRKASELDIAYELIYCSSDPNSLDGVVFPSLKVAIVDGTAPHVVEPTFPLAVERYVNLGEEADTERISEQKDKIIEVKNTYSSFFPRVYRMTSCAERLDDEIFEKALAVTNIDSLKKKALGIASREIKGVGQSATYKRRFCEAISPDGFVSLLVDKERGDGHTYIIENSYGLAHFLLTTLKQAALSANYACIGAYSPLKPAQMLHLHVPELSLSFITSTKDIPITGEYFRHIRLDSLTDTKLSPSERREMRRLGKLRRTFLDEACGLLKEAKLVHDKLEDLYNPYINFDGIYSLADKISDEIFENE